MKILHILPSNHVGGPNLRILSVAKEIESKQYNNVIICPKNEGDFAEKVQKNGITTYQITMSNPKHFRGIISIFENLKWILMLPLSVWEIVKIIKMEKIDLVHIQGLLTFQGSIAAILTRKKVVWHLIGSVYPDIVVSFLMPFVILISDHMLFIGNKLARYYLRDKLEKNEDKFSIIYNGINLNKFDSSSIDESMLNKIRTELSINSNEKIIGSVGNINPAKGYEYLIKAAGVVTKNFPNIKFVIVGGIIASQQDYYKKLINLAKENELNHNLIFVGKRDDIAKILSIFDIFVLPSTAEGTPMAILEAMAMEKPIIATDVGAVSEQIINNNSGVLVQPKNPEQLVVHIKDLLENENKSFTFGKNARKRVNKRFSLESSVEQYKKVYDSLLS